MTSSPLSKDNKALRNRERYFRSVIFSHQRERYVNARGNPCGCHQVAVTNVDAIEFDLRTGKLQRKLWCSLPMSSHVASIK